MNVTSTSSRMTGLIPGALRETDAASTNKPGASGAGGGAATPSGPSSPPSQVAASEQAGGTEPSFSASDAQAALQGALRALADRPVAAIAAQAPPHPSSVLGLLEVA